jgi:hypothetical protein
MRDCWGGNEGQEGINREMREMRETGNQLNIQQRTRNIQQPTESGVRGQESEVGVRSSESEGGRAERNRITRTDNDPASLDATPGQGKDDPCRFTRWVKELGSQIDV